VAEDLEGSDRKSQNLDSERLRQQAEEIRRDASLVAPPSTAAPSRLAQAAYLVLLVVVVAAVIFLIASERSRLGLIETVAAAWGRATGTESAEIYRLPAPPPKAVEPRVVLQGTPTFTYRSSPQLEGGQPIDERYGPDAAEPARRPGPPERTAGSNAAYQLLTQKSEHARRLSTNAIPEYQFKEWRPVRNEPPDFWVDVIATREGREIHFIWSINTETEVIRPLSQDARDLERR
jgi:hypothetical protein